LRVLLRFADFVGVGVEAFGEADTDTDADVEVVRDFDLVVLGVDVDSAWRLRGFGVPGRLPTEDIFSVGAWADLTGE
jgi:hypothetical protein